MKQLKVLGLIPARGGSKGIPRKNVAPLLGRPLLAYTVEAAQKAKKLARLVLSTDDEVIAQTGREFGVDVPFSRPPELAQDETPMLLVVQHAIRMLEQQGHKYDAICLLQPTSPLRTPDMIDACIELLENSGADAVMSVSEVPHHYNPHWVYFQDNLGRLQLSTGEVQPISRRQALPRAFHREGSVYVTIRDIVMESDSLYGEYVVGYVVEPETSVNIDTPADLVKAGALARSFRQ